MTNCTPTPTPTPTPSHAALYVNTNGVVPGVHGYNIQPNGSLSEFPSSPFTFTNLGGGGIGFANGNLFLTTFQDAGVPVTNAVSAAVNFTTGALTPVGSALPAEGSGQGGQFIQCQNRFLFNSIFTPPSLLGGTHQIFAFSIDSMGLLHAAPGSPFAIDSTSLSAAVDPACRFLFVFSQNGIFSFAIDATTGALASLGSPFVFSNNPDVGAVDPSGNFLFAVGPVGVSTLALNSSGVLSLSSGPVAVPASGGGIAALVVSQASGNFLYVSAFSTSGNVPSIISGYKISAGTLTPVPVPSVNSGNNTESLVSFGSFLYAVNLLDNNISAYTINSDGTLTVVPGSPFGMQNLTTSAIHPTQAVIATSP